MPLIVLDEDEEEIALALPTAHRACVSARAQRGSGQGQVK